MTTGTIDFSRQTSIASSHGDATCFLFTSDGQHLVPSHGADRVVWGELEADEAVEVQSFQHYGDFLVLNNIPSTWEEVAVSISSSDWPQSSWLGEARREARKLRRLPADWNGHDAPAPSKVACDLADRVLCAFSYKDIPRPRIAPSVEGGVGISFEQADRYAFIECYNDGEIVAGVSSRESGQDAWEVNAKKWLDLHRCARRIADFLRT